MPSLRYRDLEAAIAWLGDAFGFEERDVAAEADGTIRHAQMTLGSDMIMLLPAPAQTTDGRGQQHFEVGGAETQSLYFVVDDVEAHYRRSMAAGADILEDGEFAFGGHGYSCRDPEGHIWHFGSFNPRQQATGNGAWIREFLYGKRARGFADRLRDRLNPPVLVAAVAATIVAAAVFGMMLFALPQTSASPKERGLAFSALIAPQVEQAGVDTPTPTNAPLQVGAPSLKPALRALRAKALPAPSRPKADEVAHRDSLALAPTEAPHPNDEGAARGARQTVEKALDKVRIARQAADRAGEEALGRLHAAQQASSPPSEAREQAAIAPPDRREQRIAREEAPKEPAAKLGAAQKTTEHTSKEARNWRVETKLAKPAPAQLANVPARRKQDAKADAQGAWDCVPSPPTGQIVCHPPGKKGTLAKASPEARRQLIAAETSAERKPQASLQQSPQEQAVGGQLWGCQPSPPNGDVVCRPIDAHGRATP